ncbi:regulator of chromosome condensation family protein, partial [Trifolium medium]|nr:regulator of chromosome condensation family protein [Trifolium medium]
CRGSGEDGQLGIGTNEDKEWVCTVKALPSQRVRSVVAGSRNSLAICHDGKLFTWGWNQRGTLGHPAETKTENIPSQVKALSHVHIVQCGEEPERKDDNGRPLRRDIVIPQPCAPKLAVRQ